MGSIHENIKSIRIKKSYSQEFMASKLGMEQVSYGLIENNKRKLRYETLEQIALIFKMPIIDIIAYPDECVLKDKTNAAKKTHKVSLQIDIDQDDIKADVIKLVLGNRVLEIKNK